jgi:hypothetical protein
MDSALVTAVAALLVAQTAPGSNVVQSFIANGAKGAAMDPPAALAHVESITPIVMKEVMKSLAKSEEKEACGKPLPTVERSYTQITAEAIIFPVATATRWRSRVVIDAAGQLAFIAVGEKQVDLPLLAGEQVDLALLEPEDDLPGLTTIDSRDSDA